MKWQILHYVSAIGTFMLLYGAIYLILRYTIGQIPLIKNTTIYGLPIEVPLFSVAAITFIATCVKISSPYAEMIQK